MDTKEMSSSIEKNVKIKQENVSCEMHIINKFYLAENDLDTRAL